MLKNDAKIRESVEAIEHLSKKFLDLVNTYGCQMGHTDRLVEDIVKESLMLEQLHKTNTASCL